MSLTRKVAFNTIIQIVGKVVTTGISLVLIAALTRYLGVAGFGQYTTAFAYVAFFAVFADFGFFWIFVREIANPKTDVSYAASNILTLRTFLGVIIYGLAFLVSFLIPQYADLRWGIGITALASLFLALNSTYVGVFQNKLKMERAALTDIIGRVIILILTLYFIKLNLGLNAVLWAYTLGNIVNLAASYYLGREFVHFKPSFDFEYWKKIFLQALPMGIVLILNMIYFKIDTLMLSLMKGPIDVGIYGPPYKVLEILLFVPSIFMGNVFPILTRYIHTKDSRVYPAFQKSFEFMVLLAFPVVLGVIFTASDIIRIVAGKEFTIAQTIAPIFNLPATSVLTLQILIIAVGISFFSHLFGYFVIALGKQSKMVLPNIILVIVNVGLNLLIIPKFSYIGAAITTVITEILVAFFSWWVVRQIFEIKLRLAIFWKAGLAGVVFGVSMYLLEGQFNFIVNTIIASIIYLSVLWFLGGINKQMFIDVLRPQKEKEGLE